MASSRAVNHVTCCEPHALLHFFPQRGHMPISRGTTAQHLPPAAFMARISATSEFGEAEKVRRCRSRLLSASNSEPAEGSCGCEARVGIAEQLSGAQLLSRWKRTAWESRFGIRGGNKEGNLPSKTGSMSGRIFVVICTRMH